MKGDDQLVLFETAADVPLARRTDPPSSHRAAAKVSQTTDREKTIEALRTWGPSTSRRLGQGLCWARYRGGRRLSQLDREGVAVKDGTERVTGEVVYRLSDGTISKV